MKFLAKKTIVLAAAGLLASGVAQAALLDRGGGLIYDDVLNVTWLQDANYASTSGYAPGGVMSWSQALAWADSLVYGGYDDWRLPATLPLDGATYNLGWSANGSTDRGYNQSAPGTSFAGSTQSEMAYMNFANLDGTAYYDFDGNHQSPWGLQTNGPFINLAYTYYWSGTAYPLIPGKAWAFAFGWGAQDYDMGEGETHLAWAVRDGDVAATAPIPEPETYAMMLAGLGLLGFMARRRKLKAYA